MTLSPYPENQPKARKTRNATPSLKKLDEGCHPGSGCMSVSGSVI